MRKLILLLAFSGLAAVSPAQRHCGFLEAQDYLFKQDPTARARTEALINQANAPGALQARPSSAANYTIPVVFHVLHMNGAENISDAQIQDQIAVMNRDFTKQNWDTSNAVSAFQNLIGNPGVEFRLATIDPDGNCTNGITRHYDPNTNWTVNFSNYLYTWDRSKYMNIYVVKTMPTGAAAYAYYPGTVSPVADAIVVQSDYVGSIGTGNAGTSRIITHEAGHWMNLQHLWGSTNNPGVACGDDGVSDTPITKGYTWCNLSNAIDCTPGVTENMQNYMDYAYCQIMFTPGQCLRMQNALNSSVDDRNNLWTNANLVATGVINPLYNCAPKAQYLASTTITCEGNTLLFTDDSYNAPISSWEWSSPLAASSSFQQNGALTFAAPGLTPVQLKVSNAFGSDSIIETNVRVLGGPGSGNANVVQGFESGVFPDTYWGASQPQYGSPFVQTSQAAYMGSNCVWVDNFTDNPSEAVSFFSPAFNLQNVTAADLSFWYAYAQRNTFSDDRLKVYVSFNCGASWVSIFNKSGAALSTAGSPLGTTYIPSPGNWQEVLIDLMPQAGTPSLYFKFEFTPDANGAGNNIFIDHINLAAIYSTPTGLANNGLQSLFVSPNPFSEGVILTGEAVEAITMIQLRDISGRVVVADQHPVAKEHTLQLQGLDQLARGVYFMQAFSAEGIKTFKIVKE